MTMTNDDTSLTNITRYICDLIEEVLGFEKDEYTLGSSFADDLEADSLAMVELQASIEEHFDLPEGNSPALFECRTPAQVIHLVSLVLQESGAL